MILPLEKFLGITVEPSALTSPQPVSALDPKVRMLMDILTHSSSQHIKTYLASNIDEISFSQLRKAQDKIEEISKAYHVSDYKLVEQGVLDYFRIIPTQLPSKPNVSQLVEAFVQQFSSQPDPIKTKGLKSLSEPQEDRLNQMMSALANRTITGTQAVSNSPKDDIAEQFRLLGTDILHLDTLSETYKGIEAYVRRTLPGTHIEAIFQVRVPIERAAFESAYKDVGNVYPLFHGTNTANGIHILKTGLIIPRSHANGSRFGRGIYFADRAQRSYSYTQSNRAGFNLMFITDVALGNMYKSNTTLASNVSRAPKGYNSVWGHGTYSGAGDEYIVYQTNQQTLQAIVLLGN